jgi:tetratricopeptide (TPR) repeat protein
MQKLTLAVVIVMIVVGLGQRAVAIPDDQPGTQARPPMTVAELEKAGDAARAQKDYDQAIQYFREALRKDRKNAVLYNKMGLAQLKLSDPGAARSSFEKSAKYNPKYADALNNVGATYYVQRNYGSAAKYFKKALALAEDRAVFHVNLGAAWFGQNKLDRAVAEYSRAVELDPDALNQNSAAGVAAQIASPEERAKYSYMLAKIYAKRGDVDQCLQCLKKAKEEGYRSMANVYKEEEFSRLWQDQRLNQIVPPPPPR